MDAQIEAVPSRENGYSYVVRVADGSLMYLRGIGAPKDAKVGDKGKVTYRSNATMGYLCWSA